MPTLTEQWNELATISQHIDQLNAITRMPTLTQQWIELATITQHIDQLNAITQQLTTNHFDSLNRKIDATLSQLNERLTLL